MNFYDNATEVKLAYKVLWLGNANLSEFTIDFLGILQEIRKTANAFSISFVKGEPSHDKMQKVQIPNPKPARAQSQCAGRLPKLRIFFEAELRKSFQIPPRGVCINL